MGKMVDTFLGALYQILTALFNEVFVPAMSEIMSALFIVIITPIKWYFAYSAYVVLIGLCTIIDGLENILNIFMGAVPLDNADGKTLLETIFQMNAINNAFLYITVAAVSICFVLTIVAVAKSMSSMTLENKKPVTYVLKSTAKACVSFIMVPLLCLFMLSMSNIVVGQAQTAMTAHLGTDKVPTTGEYIFLTASLRAGKKFVWNDVLTDTMNTLKKYKAILVDDNLESFGVAAEALDDALTQLTDGSAERNFTVDDPRVQQLEEALAQLDGVAKTTDLPAKVLETKKLAEAAVDTIREEFVKINESSYPYLEPSMNDDLRMAYLTGEKDYKNFMHSGMDFTVFKIDYLMGFLAGGFILLMFAGLVIQFIRRMLELVVLYLTAPFFVAVMPLDDGEMFKKWRENFIAKFLSGFSVLFALKLYLLLLPLIFSSNLDLGTTIIGDIPNMGSASLDIIDQTSGTIKDVIDENAGGDVEVAKKAEIMDGVVKSATGYASELGFGDNTLYENVLVMSGMKNKGSPSESAAFVDSLIKLIFLVGGTWAIYKSQTLVMDILHPDTSESTRQTTILAFAAAKKVVTAGVDVAKKGAQIGGTVALGAVTGGVGGVAAAGLQGGKTAAKGAAAAAKAASGAAKTATGAVGKAAGGAKEAVKNGSDDS